MSSDAAAPAAAAGGTSLLDLPDLLLIDNLAPYLSPSDLASLRRTSKRSQAVFDDEILWKRRTMEHFRFSPHASARVGGWRKLYRSLAKPQAWLWGQSGNGRLGLGQRERGDGQEAAYLRHITRDVAGGGGIPFPVRNDIVSAASKTSRSQLELGSVVELVAGGWAFHARTSTGKVIYWGSMDGEGYGGSHASLRDPSKEVDTPTLLDLPADVVVEQLSCGRSHAVALTDKGDVLEWRAWATVWKHEDLLPMQPGPSSASSAPLPHAKVLQLEAGWDYTTLLVESTAETATMSSAQQSTSYRLDVGKAAAAAGTTDVYLWYPEFSEYRYRPAYFADVSPESQFESAWSEPTNNEKPARIQCPALKLPQLPSRDLGSDAGATTETDAVVGYQEGGRAREDYDRTVTRQKLVRIAAGENFVLALTDAGLVYKFDIPSRSPNPADRHLPNGSLRSLADAQRIALVRRLRSDRVQWQLLSHFCLPQQLRALPELGGADGGAGVLEGKSDEQMRISHISAHFRTFVVYTSHEAQAALGQQQQQQQRQGEQGGGRPGGIVLLGSSDAGGATRPTVMPQLQDAGVIKVVLGDYHFGALTEGGEVWTWGSWSKGALGLWHDLPKSRQPPPQQPGGGEGSHATTQPEDEGYDDTANLVPLPRILPHFHIGRAGAGLVPRAGSHAARYAGMRQTSQVARPGGQTGGDDREVPEHVDEPRAVHFRPLPAGGSTVGGDGGGRGTRCFAFDIAFAGWHSSALVMDVDDGGDAAKGSA